MDYPTWHPDCEWDNYTKNERRGYFRLIDLLETLDSHVPREFLPEEMMINRIAELIDILSVDLILHETEIGYGSQYFMISPFQMVIDKDNLFLFQKMLAKGIDPEIERLPMWYLSSEDDDDHVCSMTNVLIYALRDYRSNIANYLLSLGYSIEWSSREGNAIHNFYQQHNHSQEMYILIMQEKIKNYFIERNGRARSSFD